MKIIVLLIMGWMTLSTLYGNTIDSPKKNKALSASDATNNKHISPQLQVKKEMAKFFYGNELLGAGHLWAFIAGYRFNEDFLVNTGFTYILIPGKTYNADFFIIPLTLSYMFDLTSSSKHFIELQAGTLFSIPAELQHRTADRTGHRASATSQPVVPITGIGYRYQPRTNGWFFRAAVYGVIGEDPILKERKVRWWPGLSLGRTF